MTTNRRQRHFSLALHVETIPIILVVTVQGVPSFDAGTLRQVHGLYAVFTIIPLVTVTFMNISIMLMIYYYMRRDEGSTRNKLGTASTGLLRQAA